VPANESALEEAAASRKLTPTASRTTNLDFITLVCIAVVMSQAIQCQRKTDYNFE
jgi:hypothetical protein